MDSVVRLRINRRTGAIEFVEVDAERDGSPESEHNARHEDLAAEIGQLFDLFPQVDEIQPGTRADRQTQTHAPEPGDEIRHTEGPATEAGT